MENKDKKKQKTDPGCLYIVAAVVMAAIIGGVLDMVQGTAARYRASQKQELSEDSIAQSAQKQSVLLLKQRTK